MGSRLRYFCLLRQSLVGNICRSAARPSTRSFNVLLAENSSVITKLTVLNLQSLRHKSKKKGKARVLEDGDDSDDEVKEKEDEEDEGEEVIPGAKVMNFKVTSARVDRIVTKSVGSKQIMEEAFLQGKIRRNNEKVLKKATEVLEGDVLDVVLGEDEVNPSMLRVSRFEVIEIQVHNNSCLVRGRIFKDIPIKHYDT